MEDESGIHVYPLPGSPGQQWIVLQEGSQYSLEDPDEWEEFSKAQVLGRAGLRPLGTLSSPQAPKQMVGGQSDLRCRRSGKEEQGRLRHLTDQVSHLELPQYPHSGKWGDGATASHRGHGTGWANWQACCMAPPPPMTYLLPLLHSRPHLSYV